MAASRASRQAPYSDQEFRDEVFFLVVKLARPVHADHELFYDIRPRRSEVFVGALDEC
jgi:hypothetical protein